MKAKPIQSEPHREIRKSFEKGSGLCWIRPVRRGTIDVECFMRTITVIIAAAAVLSGRLVAQETKPGVSVPDGTHFRMNGPKKLIAEIKAHEGSMIQITGVTKKSQYRPAGVSIGGVRIGPGRAATCRVAQSPTRSASTSRAGARWRVAARRNS